LCRKFSARVAWSQLPHGFVSHGIALFRWSEAGELGPDTQNARVRRTEDKIATAQRESESIEKVTPYDQFNIEISQDAFPAEGMAARAAQAIVNSYAWTDANPMLNLSSFVTTYAEPEAVEIARQHFTKNYIYHDMYPQVFVLIPLTSINKTTA